MCPQTSENASSYSLCKVRGRASGREGPCTCGETSWHWECFFSLLSVTQGQPNGHLFRSPELVRDEDLKSHPDLRNQNLPLNKIQVRECTLQVEKHFPACPSLRGLLSPSVCPEEGWLWEMTALSECCSNPKGRGRKGERQGVSRCDRETRHLVFWMQPGSTWNPCHALQYHTLLISLLFSENKQAFTASSCLLE